MLAMIAREYHAVPDLEPIVGLEVVTQIPDRDDLVVVEYSQVIEHGFGIVLDHDTQHVWRNRHVVRAMLQGHPKRLSSVLRRHASKDLMHGENLFGERSGDQVAKEGGLLDFSPLFSIADAESHVSAKRILLPLILLLMLVPSPEIHNIGSSFGSILFNRRNHFSSIERTATACPTMTRAGIDRFCLGTLDPIACDPRNTTAKMGTSHLSA